MGALVQLVEVGHTKEVVRAVLLQQTEASGPFALSIGIGVVSRLECARGLRYLLLLNEDCSITSKNGTLRYWKINERTRGLIAKKVVLLSERSASALERGYNVYDLRLSVDRLEICAGFSVYTFNVEQRHVMYLGSRAVLRRTWGEGMRMGITMVTYEGFLHFIDGFVEGVAIGRKYRGGESSFVIDLHLRAGTYE